MTPTTSATDRDTICAISTPPGIGGIAVARISGPDAITIADSIWKGRPLSQAATHTAHLGTIADRQGRPLDQAVATVFRAPRSFTGDNVVELSVHGSRYVQRELLNTLCAAGARLAEAGEFTRRAFTSGRLDLAEAEAVADVIASNSRAAHRIAISQLRGNYSRRLKELRQQLIDLASLLELELDFSEEEVEFASRTQLRALAVGVHDEVSRLARSFSAGAAIKEGIPVAIVGATNAGKSSLLNALIGDDRAIVSDIHGTTRDTIEETLEIGDYLFRFIDTAGLRHTSDTIERIGIDRSLRAIDKARIVILLIDPAAPVDAEILRQAVAPVSRDNAPAHLIIALNKADIATPQALADARSAITRALGSDADPQRLAVITLSARTGANLDNLRQLLTSAADRDTGAADEDLLVTNLRHAQALEAAAQSTAAVIDGLDTQLPPDLIAQDLRQTIHHLSTITGQITSTDILTTIFSRFCIGK